MSTAIQWTAGDDGSPGETWNPTTGCDRISPGCDNCYALTMAKRLKAMGQAKYQTDGQPPTSGPGFGLAMHPDALTVPLHWRRPRRVFINSMSDLGHARVSPEFLARVWAVMAATPQHTYQILSKRPERLQRRLNQLRFIEKVTAALEDLADDEWVMRSREVVPQLEPWPLRNVWLGTSIESDRYCLRADDLRETTTAIRFLSLEPLLGPLPSLDLDGIDWVILGGESGQGQRPRPMDLGWVRDLIARCQDAGVAVFVKQLGTCWAREHDPLGDQHGGDLGVWPADLAIREFPATVGAPA